MAIWPPRLKKIRLSRNIGQSKNAGNISPYHCIEVDMPYDACDEVLKLNGVRFLSAEAPILPLPACRQHCTCKFKHYNDRRHDDRRDAYSPSGIHFSGGKNRRLSDRRHGARSHASIGTD